MGDVWDLNVVAHSLEIHGPLTLKNVFRSSSAYLPRWVSPKFVA